VDYVADSFFQARRAQLGSSTRGLDQSGESIGNGHYKPRKKRKDKGFATEKI
jgi:hypothetical protein